MGRRTTHHASKHGVVALNDGVTWEKLAARGVSRLTPLLPPWLVGAALYPAGALTHHLWGEPGVLPWMSIGMTAAGSALSALTWKVSRQRKLQGRLHTTATTAFASMWMTTATITGPGAEWTTNLGLLGGATLAVGWNIRQIIRYDETAEGGGAQRGFKAIFGAAAEKAGLEGATLKRLEVESPAKAVGQVGLEGGDTADDLRRRLPQIESLLGLPPGSLTANEDLDDAALAQLIVSNPALLRQPVPYPGPSRPGASAGDPVRVGLAQDGEPAEWQLVNNHTQVMGRSGSAKSFGGFWNFGGEVMTRVDAGLFAIDLDKGEQTIGPMRRGLHRVETTPAGAKRLMRQFYAVIRVRTDHLGERGLSTWEPGCGLTFLVLWLEEAASIMKHLDEEEFKEFARTARSAGIHLVVSLQRADFTQLPTFVRGQLSKWCFGLEDAKDAPHGLTEAQQAAGCSPEMWGNKQPGMAYLDGLGVPAERVAIPHRTYMWTVEQMRAHAAAYPATARPLDPVTARVLQAGPGGWANPDAPAAVPAAPALDDGQEDETEEDVNVTEEYLNTPDPDPTTTAHLDDDLNDAPGEWSFDGGKMSPEQAQVVLRSTIESLRGREFRPRDLGDVLKRTGRGRTWIQNHLRTMVEAGELRHDEATGTYELIELPPAAA